MINETTIQAHDSKVFIVNLFDRANGQVVCWRAFATKQGAEDYVDYCDLFNGEISEIPSDDFHGKISKSLVRCPSCNMLVEEENVYQNGECVECGRPSRSDEIDFIPTAYQEVHIGGYP